jgi:hypothetical protein
MGTDAAMVERAEREPTMEEIVVALRETGRAAARVAPFSVVGGQSDGMACAPAPVAAVPRTPPAMTDIGDLRDAEIERLLAENARLNERVMVLVRIVERERAESIERERAGDIERERAGSIERERARSIERERAAATAVETNRGATVRDMRVALEAELRPVLLALLRLVEKQHPDPPGADVAPSRRAVLEPVRSATAATPPHDANGIVDYDAQTI